MKNFKRIKLKSRDKWLLKRGYSDWFDLDAHDIMINIAGLGQGADAFSASPSRNQITLGSKRVLCQCRLAKAASRLC